MTKRGWCWCRRWWWWWWWCWWWRSWSCGPWVTATVRAHPLPPLSPSIKGIFLENWKLTSSQNTKGIVINTKHDTLDSTHIISNNDYIIPNNKETIYKEQSYIITKKSSQITWFATADWVSHLRQTVLLLLYFVMYFLYRYCNVTIMLLLWLIWDSFLIKVNMLCFTKSAPSCNLDITLGNENNVRCLILVLSVGGEDEEV